MDLVTRMFLNLCRLNIQSICIKGEPIRCDTIYIMVHKLYLSYGVVFSTDPAKLSENKIDLQKGAFVSHGLTLQAMQDRDTVISPELFSVSGTHFQRSGAKIMLFSEIPSGR